MSILVAVHWALCCLLQAYHGKKEQGIKSRKLRKKEGKLLILFHTKE
jgi:hypothetical protein